MNIAQNPNSELSHFAVNTPQVFEIPETFRETARQFQEAMMQYSCAIREFKTKLEVLNDELSMRNARNPIEMIVRHTLEVFIIQILVFIMSHSYNHCIIIISSRSAR